MPRAKLTRSWFLAEPLHLPFYTNECEMCESVWYLYDRGLDKLDESLTLHKMKRITETKALVLQLEGRPVRGSVDA